ncbi:MAG: DUF4834 domain-containing protein [Sphingobacteriaceae bacterium]|nr:DUF4834 domain-containing protein [Sphingobacteriaceae bacterium]
MAVLEFIFIVILVFYILKNILRLLFPIVLRNLFGKMQQQQQANYKQTHKPEGSISIDYLPKDKKQGNADKLGDFVEYEEIK